MTSTPHPPNSTAATAPHRAVVPAEIVPEQRGALAVMSHVTRGGDWILARQFRAVACMGALDLDLTDARIGSGISRIEVKAIMGAVTVIVPPDIRVECDGDSVIAAFEIERKTTITPPPDAPLIVITGTAFLGAVEVKIVDPNAPGWYDKLRARLSRGGVGQ